MGRGERKGQREVHLPAAFAGQDGRMCWVVNITGPLLRASLPPSLPALFGTQRGYCFFGFWLDTNRQGRLGFTSGICSALSCWPCIGCVILQCVLAPCWLGHSSSAKTARSRRAALAPWIPSHYPRPVDQYVTETRKPAKQPQACAHSAPTSQQPKRAPTLSSTLFPSGPQRAAWQPASSPD